MSVFSPPNERAVVVGFLRKHTHLRALADLLEAGVHWKTNGEIRAYCAARGILLAGEEVTGK